MLKAMTFLDEVCNQEMLFTYGRPYNLLPQSIWYILAL